MRIGGFKGVLLVVVACFTLFLSLILVNNSNAQSGGQTTVISGKSTGYNFNQAGNPPLKWYISAPPLMVAAKVGSGTVVAVGIASTCRDNRWNNPDNPDPYLDVLLDKAFQWMKPGAAKVLWYEGYGVYNTITTSPVQCANLRDALQSKGYTLTGDVTTPITSNLLSGYDILVIPQLQLGDPGTGGNPDLLPDADVQVIINFVNGGGGLFIMDASDYAGLNYNNVHNKILKALSVGFYFQDDQAQDDTNKWGAAAYQPIAAVDTTTSIGSAYQGSTGKIEIGLYNVCSLRTEENYDVSVTVSPAVNLAKAGETMTVNARITNIGLKPDNYTITVEDNLGWLLSLSENTVRLENGENADIYVSVTVPSGLTKKMVDWVTLNASGVLGEENENARFRAINTFPENQPEYPLARPDATRFLGPGIPDLIVDLPAVPIITAIGSGYSNDITPRAPWPLLYGQGEFPPVAAAAFVDNGRVVATANAILRDKYFPQLVLSNEQVMSDIVRWMENWENPAGKKFLYYVSEAALGTYHLPSIVTNYLGMLGNLGFDVTTQVGGQITASSLENVSILNIAEILRPLSADELQAVTDFVNNGGNLIIMADADYGGYGNVNYPNAVLENLNCPIRFQDDEVYDDNSWVIDGPWYPQVYLLDLMQVNPNFDMWLPPYDFTVGMRIRAITANDVRVLFPFTITNTGIMSSSYNIEVQETSSIGWGVNWWPTDVSVASGENIQGYVTVTVPKVQGLQRMDLSIKVPDQNQTFLSDNISFAILGDNMVTIPPPKFENGQRVSVIQGGEGAIVDLGYSGAGVWTYVVQTTGDETRIVPEGELTYLGSHSPIYINGNDNFTSANDVVGGSGTAGDPYIIENWDISAESANGIDVENTTAYFVIRNCYVHDGRDNLKHGIFFYNVINGKIDNVKSENNGEGIELNNSNSNSIINSSISYSDNVNVNIYSSDNNTFSGCTISNTYIGISLELSSNDNLSNCIIQNHSDVSISLFNNSDNNSISNNLVENNGYGIFLSWYSGNNLIENNTVENNSLEGIGLYNYSDNNLVSSNIVENNPSGIHLYYSNNNIISNNIADNNFLGLWLDYSSYDNLLNNTCGNNGEGIHLDYSDNNLISGSTVGNSGNGIHLDASDNNLIYGNIVGNSIDIENALGMIYNFANNNLISNNIVENTDWGIGLTSYSHNNLIYHNNFVNNATKAYDYGANYWDDGYPSGGNYWSDYNGADNYRGENQNIPGSDGIGDTPYNISGGSNQDRCPLMHLFTQLVITPGTISGKPLVDGVMINDNTPMVKLSISDAALGIENAPFNSTDNSGYTVQLQGENGVPIDNLVNATPPAENMPHAISFDNTYPTALADGTYRIYVVAGDNLQMDNLVISFVIDTTPPDAPILTATASQNPLAPDIKKTTTTSLGGIGEPGATIRIWTTPEPFTSETNVENVIVGSDGIWTASITLIQGVTVRIRVSQVDIAGNESTKNQYGYLKVDASAPVVQITLPATGTKTADTEILVSGIVTKDAWEAWTDITLRVQSGVTGMPVIIPISNGSFTVYVTLAEGLNTIMATATDAVGNYTSHIVTVERTVTPPVTPPTPVDTTPPPTPSLVSPANGANITDNTPTLDWSDVSDPSGVTYNLTVARDAGFVSIALQKTGLNASKYELTPAEALTAGAYYWRVRAIDGAGNAGSWSDNWSFSISSPKPPLQSVEIPLITSGAPASVDVRNTAVTALGISVLHTVENVGITIQELVDRPSGLAIAAPGVIYRYLDITKVNIADNDISSVIITFRVEKVWITAQGIDENTTSLKRYNSENGEWVSLPTVKVGEDATYVYFSSTSPGLSYFAVSGTVITPVPAAFTLSALTISSLKVSVGKEVSISVMVKNSGDLAGTYVVTLEVNGIVEHTENVTLAGGATRVVTFTISEDTEGTYDVGVNGQTGAFTVTKPPPAPKVLPLVFGVGGIIAIIGIAVLFFTRWR